MQLISYIIGPTILDACYKANNMLNSNNPTFTYRFRLTRLKVLQVRSVKRATV